MNSEKLPANRRKLLGAGAAIAVAAATAGLLVGRQLGSTSGVQANAAASGESREKASPEREGFVAMSRAMIAANSIQTAAVSEGSIASEIIAQATVTAPPDGQALLTARADGAVVRIDKRLGDPVGAGETVALLESREAAAFMAERNSAAARALAARSVAARERRLFNQRITARQDLEAADAARAQAEAELQRAEAAVRTAGVTGNGRYLAVRSPISGRVSIAPARLGAYVSAGAELMTVADPRRIQIDAAVSAEDAQRIRQGDPAVIELSGGGSVDAVVRSSTPALDPQSRSATIVLQPLGTPAGLVQGQAVRARITPRATVISGAILLPEEAVQQIAGRDSVFVRVPGGFQAVAVTVASRSGGRVQIVGGLRAGMVVAMTNAFLLKSQLGAGEAGQE